MVIIADHMQAFSIRTVKPTDISAITRIYAHAVRHGTASFEIDPPDDAEMARRRQALFDGGYPYLVAEIAGAVAGYAYAGPYRLRPAYRWSVEDSIYIAPEHQRNGLGRALLNRLITESEARGFRQLIAVIGDFGQCALDRAASRDRVPVRRHAGGGRLQVRPVARQCTDATSARTGGWDGTVTNFRFRMPRSSDKRDRSTRDEAQRSVDRP